MPQAQLETIEVAGVFPIGEKERFCIVVSYDPTTVDRQDRDDFNIWLARFCGQLKETIAEWHAGSETFLVLGLPQNVSIKFERVEAEEVEDVHAD